MARARARRIPPAGRAQQPHLTRRVRRWLAGELRRLLPRLRDSAEACQADAGRRHFTAVGHACLLLFHGLSGSPSLEQSHARFASCAGLARLSGLAVLDDQGEVDPDLLGVSYSHFALSNTTRPAQFLAGIVPDLVARVRAAGALPEVPFPLELVTLDSTFLRLSLALSPWLPCSHRHDIPGQRLQVLFRPAADLPEGILLHTTRTNDCQGLDQLILDDPQRLASLRDLTLAMDLGYYSHARFARLLAAGVHFVSRLQAQATVVVEADLEVQATWPELPPGRIRVLSDQRISLGSPTNRHGTVLAGLRLVRAEVAPTAAAARQGALPVVYTLVTDRFDLPAELVAWFYVWRWQIELFFRWLKVHLRLTRPLGRSPNAVELSIWLVLIVQLLTVLALRALDVPRRSPLFRCRLADAVIALTWADLTEPVTTQLAFPNWLLDGHPPRAQPDPSPHADQFEPIQEVA
jgi:Transposase DDE domain